MSSLQVMWTRVRDWMKAHPNASVAGGGLLLLVVIALIVGGGDDEESTQAPQATPPPRLGRLVAQPSLGMAIRYPRGWRASRPRRTIRLTRRDQNTVIVISSPGPVRDAREIMAEARRTVRSNYTNTRLSDPHPERLADLPARTVVGTALSRKGTRLRILLTVARGERRAYLVTLFTSSPRPTQAIVEAQTMLNSLQLTK